MSLRERPVPWCLTHDSAGGGIPEIGCFAASTGHGDPADCVERDFVLRPIDALVIEKVNGEWPDWALAELNEPPLWAYNRFDQLVTLSATVLLNGLSVALESHQGGIK